LIEAVVRPPRIWLGPQNQIFDCDAEDQAHAAMIAANPERFGIDVALIRQLQHNWAENDEEFDFDYVIALAEEKGWLRISRDAVAGVAVSGASLPLIHRGVKWLADNGYLGDAVDIEVERIVGTDTNREYHYLNGEGLSSFLKSRRIRPARG